MIDAVNRTALSTSGRSATAMQQLPPIKREEVHVDASYRAAELEIRLRNPEMSANWDPIWEELGFLKLGGQIKEVKALAAKHASEAISRQVQAGHRARDLHKEKGNVFGKIAFNDFLASRKKQVQIAAAPRFGIKIDVRIYPPEIKFETHVFRGGNRSQ